MLAAQAAFDAEHGHLPGHLKDLKGEHVLAKRESLDSSDGGFSGLGEDTKVVEAAPAPPVSLGQPVQPLPSLFGRSIHNTSNEDLSSEGMPKSDADNLVVNTGCDSQTEPHEAGGSGNAVVPVPPQPPGGSGSAVAGNGSMDPSSHPAAMADHATAERQRALFNENHPDQQQQTMQSSPTVHSHQPYQTAFPTSTGPPGQQSPHSVSGKYDVLLLSKILDLWELKKPERK